MLRALQILVLAGLIGTGVAVGVGVWELASAAPIRTTVFVDATSTVGLPSDIKADKVSEVGVEIAEPSPRQRILYGLTRAPSAFLLLATLAMLAHLLERARRTDPFTLKTVQSLRWIGLVLAAGVPVVALESWAQMLLSETITPGRFTASAQIPYVWLLGGFVCLTVAEMVKRACAMREELATVI